MKNIKKIISAIISITAIITGTLGINAWNGNFFHSPVTDGEYLKKLLGKYEYAYYMDNEIPMDVYSNDEIYCQLAEPIIFTKSERGYCYFDSDIEVISGSIPTPSDFSEFEGMETIILHGENYEDGQYIANNISLCFEKYEYTNAAYKELIKDYNNPILKNTEYCDYLISTSDLGRDIPAPVMGDVNCDSKVSVSDLISCAKYISKKTQGFDTLVGEYQADCNKDSKIDGEDLLYMIKIITGEIIL